MKISKEEKVNIARYMDTILKHTFSLSKDEKFLEACLDDEIAMEQNHSFITENFEKCALLYRLQLSGKEREARLLDLELSFLFLRWRVLRTGRRILNYTINMETLREAKKARTTLRRRGLWETKM